MLRCSCLQQYRPATQIRTRQISVLGYGAGKRPKSVIPGKCDSINNNPLTSTHRSQLSLEHSCIVCRDSSIQFHHIQVYHVIALHLLSISSPFSPKAAQTFYQLYLSSPWPPTTLSITGILRTASFLTLSMHVSLILFRVLFNSTLLEISSPFSLS